MGIKLSKLLICVVLVFGFASTAQAGVYLSIEPSTQNVDVGSQFTLDMNLANSSPEQLSSLNVWLSFNPDYLEVVDTDSGNWITTGTNVLDGPYHANFNWDAHSQNIADNNNGTISYGELSLFTNVFGSGTFAQINFLAKAPILNTQINYCITGTYGLDDTYVTDLSVNNILGGVSGASVNVIPEPMTIMMFLSGLAGVICLPKKR